MALQPAAGARDLHPGDVEANRRLCELLAEVYRLWGYQEVAPPTIERLETLEAGGGIAGREVVRLAADEPLGLRPEFTASIARAAATRLSDRPRPLRLWACGASFRCLAGEGEGVRIIEELHSGVELLGEPSAAADTELMHLLLAAVATLGLRAEHRPTLLVGHHGVLDALLSDVPPPQRAAVRHALTTYDRLVLEGMDLPRPLQQRLRELISLRGEPAPVLEHLRRWLGPLPLLEELAATLTSVADAAAALGVGLQLDPTFQPHFDLYDGLVLKLVCRGRDAPVAIASGGRYDALVGRFCQPPSPAAGTGFGFRVEAIRELLAAEAAPGRGPAGWLVASASSATLPAALRRIADLHRRGEPAELCPTPCASQAEADGIARSRGCRGAIWLGS
jgi:ATP phosphoribosyltransferase regulatory subunit